jgi:hypothetical protein
MISDSVSVEYPLSPDPDDYLPAGEQNTANCRGPKTPQSAGAVTWANAESAGARPETAYARHSVAVLRERFSCV